MAYSHGNFGYLCWTISVFVLLVFLTQPSYGNMNAIDRCWRTNPNWQRNRHQLARCSVGFAGKMTNNIGRGVINYKVTDPTDDPINPKRGTLRYATTRLRGKVWVTFQRGMRIKLGKPLLVSSFTTIDGRGADVHIAGGGCFLLQGVTNVVIHGLRFHHCQPQAPGPVMGPGSKIVQLGATDGDAIRMVSSSKIWIDHNTLSACHDGLIDVTRGSTDITISNNWFRDHDKVMLLGHDDAYAQDKNMRVTVVFNHFGPNCHQRMPRVRYGYAHVANNFYQGWGLYAIGGSMNPSIFSESNLYIAPKSNNKEVTWRKDETGAGSSWNWSSVKDGFTNGAYSSQRGRSVARPRYNRDQSFPVPNVGAVRSLTSSSGVLRCPLRSTC